MLQKRWFRILLYCAIALLFLGGVIITLRDNVLFPGEYSPPPTPTPPASTPEATPSAAATAAPPPTPTPLPEFADPVKIYFTSAEIESEIVPVGQTETGAMDAPASAVLAGWYENGPSPGEAGNAIIDGHVRWKGKLGNFAHLRDMAVGEEVVIEYADGSFHYFTAVSVDVYRLDNFPDHVMKLDIGGEPRMTLITCLGDYNSAIGTSESRVVVICREQSRLREEGWVAPSSPSPTAGEG